MGRYGEDQRPMRGTRVLEIPLNNSYSYGHNYETRPRASEIPFDDAYSHEHIYETRQSVAQPHLGGIHAQRPPGQDYYEAAAQPYRAEHQVSYTPAYRQGSSSMEPAARPHWQESMGHQQESPFTSRTMPDPRLAYDVTTPHALYGAVSYAPFDPARRPPHHTVRHDRREAYEPMGHHSQDPHRMAPSSGPLRDTYRQV